MAEKPIITANQVTLARLALLPVGSWLMYQGRHGQVIALVFMTLVGCTDFVDGWLARRYGPTVLGGLMDPIADKVFVVVVYLPFLDLGWVPAWLIGLLMLREFLVTGLRSAYERRGLKLTSTFLAKVKTWAQMGGAGVLFLMQVASYGLMVGLLLAGAALPIVFMAIRYALRRYIWMGALVFSGWFGGTLACYVAFGPGVAGQLLMLAMLGVTWVSGWGYISKAWQLLEVQALDRSEWARVVFSIAFPLVLIGTQAVLIGTEGEDGVRSLALIVTMSLEMAVGGLDNLLAHHRAQSGALPWGGRVGLITLLLVLAMVMGRSGAGLSGASPRLLAVVACAISVLGTSWEFVRGRRYYIDEKLQNKAL